MMHLNEAGNYTLISIKKQKAVSRANYLLKTIEYRIKRLNPKGITQLKLFYKDDLAHQMVVTALHKAGYSTELETHSRGATLVVSWGAAKMSNPGSPQ